MRYKYINYIIHGARFHSSSDYSIFIIFRIIMQSYSEANAVVKATITR